MKIYGKNHTGIQAFKVKDKEEYIVSYMHKNGKEHPSVSAKVSTVLGFIDICQEYLKDCYPVSWVKIPENWQWALADFLGYRPSVEQACKYCLNIPWNRIDTAVSQSFFNECLKRGFEAFGSIVWGYPEINSMLGVPCPLTKEAIQYCETYGIEYHKPVHTV